VITTTIKIIIPTKTQKEVYIKLYNMVENIIIIETKWQKKRKTLYSYMNSRKVDAGT